MKKNFKLSISDNALKKKLYQSRSFEIADILETCESSEKIRIFQLLDAAKQARVFAYIEKDEAYELLKELDYTIKKNILNNLETDDLKDFLMDYNNDELSWIIPLLSDKRKVQMKALLNYTEETAGSIMSLEFLSITLGLSVKDATTIVISNMKESDYVDTIYVITEEGKLHGTLDLKELIIARKTDDLNALINDDYVYAHVEEDIDFVIEKVRNYDIKAIPILGDNGIMLGIITADDILSELSESHDEDYNQLAMVNNFNEDDSIGRRVIKRLPWLMVSVVLNFLIATFISGFQEVLEAILVLTFFQAMILGMAGNIGTQSLAATILGLNSKEITPGKKTKKHIKRELFVSITNSLLLGIFAFVVVFLFFLVFKTDNEIPTWMVALTVGISIFVALTGSALVSVFVPLFFNKVKIDPAAASGPIITTFNDIFALLVYFGTASIILYSYIQH